MSASTSNAAGGVPKGKKPSFDTDDGIEWYARIGYLAKGVLYFLIGALALKVATTGPVGSPGSEEALVTLLRQPYGYWMVGAVAIGLAGYTVWRLVMAVRDTEQKGSDPKGLLQRTAYVASGLAYVGVIFTAFQLLVGYLSNVSEKSAWEDWSARFLQYPYGEWLVGAMGLILLGVAAEFLLRALRDRVKDDLKEEEMNSETRWVASATGRIGLWTRGTIYALMGIFLIQAAIQFNPDEVEGLGGTLRWLSEQPYGPYLLGVMGGGLMVYGIFAVIQARYRRIEPGR